MDQGKVLHWGLSEMGLQTLRRAHAALPVIWLQRMARALPEDGAIEPLEGFFLARLSKPMETPLA